ncbi:calcium and integrin-binding family member 3-like isoform X1 [Bombus vosnesenskii]|uniref:Calcium and integrin-binding family member 3-like isoform X1 n=1 Tax=Bombus vosnesenskii TaxID=207650 RepID=A0A6J3L109_9HYME|nr:calcium and integrin-binding family member 3-like isoform X1 [Bombus vosnesenskii]
MGNYLSTNYILPEETLVTYVELTYLKKNEIQYIVKILDNVNPGKLCENIQHRFTIDEVETILPQIRCSPFRDSIYRVFSSQKDNHLSLEDILDLCSAFSKHCPSKVRAAWAFYIFDFDGDNQISVDDLIETVHRLTRCDQDEHETIDSATAEHVARMILQEMVFTQQGSISFEEFIRFASRIAEFSSTFSFHFNV